MNHFLLAASGSPVAVSPAPGSAHQHASASLTVFVAMVGLAAIAWAIAMVALSSGLNKWSSSLLKKRTTAAVCVALVLIFAVLIHAYRGRNQSKSNQTRVRDRRLARPADRKLPITAEQTPVRIPPKGLNPPQPVASLPKPASTPTPRKEHAAKQHVKHTAAKLPKPPVATKLRPAHEKSTPLPKPIKANIVVHGTSALSDLQAKRLCGAVSVYAGTQIYIKWSPGANAERLAAQLSKAMDCARVTVTFASETAAASGHGVRVGTHAYEGETSDRLRPFADAITAALREQGFTVTEVSASSIPTDQTAIFIGPD